MSGSQWHIGAQESHLNVKRAKHETIYGHKEKVCLEQNISIGSQLYGIRSFYASFHHFSYFYIRQMTTKTSNGHMNPWFEVSFVQQN